MKIITETNRLILRVLTPTDLHEVFALDSDPEVHRFIGDNPSTSELQSIQSIEEKIAQNKEYGVGRWAIIDKESNDFIGWAGLKFVADETNHISNYYDLGYRLNQKFWGKGYATEAAIAILKYGFHVLNINTIYAMAEYKNIASHKVLEKIGVEFIEIFEFEGTKYKWYKIEKQKLSFPTI